jgi:hypothetical protein
VTELPIANCQLPIDPEATPPAPNRKSEIVNRKSPGWIIRRSPGGYAARFHRNLCGLQVTWTTDEDATRFATGEEAFAKAREHGLRDDQFCAVALWDVGSGGGMECWSNGVLGGSSAQHSMTPSLQSEKEVT